MKFSLEYVREYMNELDKITGFNSKDIKLSISNRLKTTYGYNDMIKDDNGNYINYQIVLSEKLFNAGISKESFEDIIGHEYCHSWADYGQKTRCEHWDERYIKCCEIVKCSPLATSNDKVANRLIDIYEYKKFNNELIKNYRKIYDTVIRNAKHTSMERTLIRKKRVEDTVLEVKVTIFENNYVKLEPELSCQYDRHIVEVKAALNKEDHLTIIDEKETIEDGLRKNIIIYKHDIKDYLYKVKGEIVF